jgi:hypothetical protein
MCSNGFAHLKVVQVPCVWPRKHPKILHVKLDAKAQRWQRCHAGLALPTAPTCTTPRPLAKCREKVRVHRQEPFSSWRRVWVGVHGCTRVSKCERVSAGVGGVRISTLRKPARVCECLRSSRRKKKQRVAPDRLQRHSSTQVYTNARAHSEMGARAHTVFRRARKAKDSNVVRQPAFASGKSKHVAYTRRR